MAGINGKKLKELRHEKHLSQFGLALETDLSRRTIENIENGKNSRDKSCGGSIESLKKLAKYFNITLEELL